METPVDEVLDKHGTRLIFSLIDLVSSSHQIAHNDTVPLTTFYPAARLFERMVIP